MSTLFYQDSRHFDLSIAARVIAKLCDDMAVGILIDYRLFTLLPENVVKGWQSVYRSDRQRFSKAKAGHYVSIIK